MIGANNSGRMLSPNQGEFHAGQNKRNDLKKIDIENARLYNQLSSKGPSVFTIEKLQAEYKNKE